MKAEEIKAKTDAAITTLVAALEQGKSDELKTYLSVMGKFHSYSFNNQMLIALQKPDATQVAGFHRWKELGRFVKKGEHGIAIIAPLVGRKKDGAEVLTETPESQLYGFRAVWVFDIAQTEGDPLPTPGIKDAFGFVGDKLERLEKFAFDRGFAVERVENLDAEGLCSPTGIKIKAGKTRADEFAVLAHEMAHALLHQGEARRERKTSKRTRELEAEAVAFVVATASGLEHPGAASYIQLYDGTAEGLKDSLSYIQQTAQTILKAIEPDETRNGQREVVRATIHETATTANQQQKEPTI